MLKAIFFDCFGTVFDLAAVDRDEIRAYVDHIHKYSHTSGPNGWRALRLPESWYDIPPHPDAAVGIRRLRSQYMVATLSNGPLMLLTRLSRQAGISWDAIVPVELLGAFKPQEDAYKGACALLGVKPEEAMMVTANKTFGDLEASSNVGMTPVLIRDTEHTGPWNIIELAEKLGC